jgi:hypothetical protein
MVTSEFLAAVQKFINSPPGQFAAGGVLAVVVWKFSERVENVLTDQSKFEIAVWLVGVDVGQRVKPWVQIFGDVFITALGDLRQRRLRRFFRVGLFSFWAVMFTNSLARVEFDGFGYEHLWWLLCLLAVSTVCNYIDLSNTAAILEVYRKRHELLGLLEQYKTIDPTDAAKQHAKVLAETRSSLRTMWFAHAGEIAIFGITGFGAAIVLFYFGILITEENPNLIVALYLGLAKPWLWSYPLFFLSPVCFFFYAVPGFLLSATRRVDIGFQWFNRRFDIEKKPLSAIGLVAGALIALVYWGFALSVLLMRKALVH